MKPIVILHGWGTHISGKTYSQLSHLLENKGFTVLAPDLPGFGTNADIKKDLQFDDYIEFVQEYLQKKDIKKVILLGHSFGGRIAIKFTSLYPETVEKLILTGASGIPRPLPSIKKKLVFAVTKIFRPLFLIPPFSLFFKLFRKLVYYAIGEMDYYKAGHLAQTFKNVYRVSIVESLRKITIPTLIVWGAEDVVTPVIDGKLMHENIHGSQLKLISGEGHKLPYSAPEKLVEAVTPFLQ